MSSFSLINLQIIDGEIVTHDGVKLGRITQWYDSLALQGSSRMEVVLHTVYKTAQVDMPRKSSLYSHTVTVPVLTERAIKV